MRIAILGCAVVAGVLAAAVWANGQPEDLLDRVRRTGVIRVGYAPEAPFAYRTADGRVTGEGPEIARVVLRTFGNVEIEWVQAEFSALIPDLVSGHFDLLAAGMFITPEREREIAFSSPTYSARAALLVRWADAERFRTYDRIRSDPEARLALMDGGYETQLAAAAGIPRDRILMVPDPSTGIAALRSGRVDALGLTSISVRQLADALADESLRAVVIPDSLVAGVPAVGFGAFGFRQGDRRFRAAFEAALGSFLGTPEHVEIARRFGYTAGEIRPAVTRP